MKQSKNSNVTKPKRLFFGWWIVAVGIIGTAMNSGLSFHGTSAFFPALEEHFGWSRTAISGAFSFSKIQSGILGPVEGFLVDKFGPRKIMIVGVLLMSGGFFVFAFVDNIITLYLAMILGISLGSTLGFSTTIPTAVANWFSQHRGKAFGLLWTGNGLGGLFVPLLTFIIISYNWRIAALIASALVLLIGIPVAIFMRHRPEDYGYLPDGAQHRPDSSPQHPLDSNTPAANLSSDFTPTQALRSSSFWFLAISVGLRHLATTGVLVHLMVFLMDKGISQNIAAFLFGTVALLSVLGRIAIAWAGDYLSKRILMGGVTLSLGLIILFMGVVESLPALLPLLLLFAFSWGGAASIIHPIRASYFGRSHYATITGLMAPLLMIGVVSGPVIAGYLFDTYQSYGVAFQIFTLSCVIGAILSFAAKPPTIPEYQATQSRTA